MCAVIAGAEGWADIQEYAEEIVENGGDYLLAVKDNQQSLANSV
ncbi:MAG: hypothetical protein ACI86X_000536 [Moritella sp.]|jgi:hypothetical protein